MVESRQVLINGYSDALLSSACLPGGPRAKPENLHDIAGACYRVGHTCDVALTKEQAATHCRKALNTGTGLLSQVFTQSVNVAFRLGFDGAGISYKGWTSEILVSTMADVRLVNVHAFGYLDEVPEGARPSAATVSMTGETAQMKTYERSFIFTEQSLVNGEIENLLRQAFASGRMVAKTAERACVSALTSNPTMADGEALFSDAHANTGSDTGLSTGSIQTAVTGMSQQTSDNEGDALDVTPSILLCPTTQYKNGLEALGDSATVGGFMRQFRPDLSVRGVLVPIYSGLLNATSETQFYAVASPVEIQGVVVVRLKQYPEPRIISERSKPGEVLGRAFRIVDIFGVAVSDFRALYKNG